MGKKCIWIAVAVGLVGGATALHASAQPGAEEHGHGGFGGLLAHFHQRHMSIMTNLHEQMNLTDGQRDQLHQTLRVHHADIAAAIRPVVAAKRELHNAVMADTTDETAIRAAATNLGSVIGDAAVTLAGIKAEVVRNVQLTAEQKQKLAEFRLQAESEVDQFIDMIEHGEHGHEGAPR